jgi:4-amino-4-deoxy-L-arabinose transferase-like glycosyltransferase
MSPKAAQFVRNEWLWFAALMAFAAWLFLANLGDQRLWDDEAQTALIAKTVMTDGVPRGYDGRNYFSQELGREYGRNYVYRWHTWLSFYVVAGVFSVCGVSQWTARIPFALMGLATVPLCYWFARSLWQSRRAAVLAAFLLSVSVPYLIFSRQCRYYSLCALLSLLGLMAYYQWMRGWRWGPIAFVVSAVLLFHSLFLYWAVLVIAVLIHAAIFHRDRLIKVAVWSGVTLLLNAPWLVWLLSPPRVGGYPDRNDPWTWPFMIFNRYLTETYLHAFSPILLVVLGVLAAVARVREKKWNTLSADTVRGASLLLLFILVNYAFLCLATPLYFFRYLAPAIPLLCLLSGKILDSAMRLHWSLGAAALAAILFLGTIPDHCYEITHHYTGPVDAMVTYLNEHGKPDDVVAITYGDLPLKFYTKMRVVGGLTGEDLTPAQEADWVIFRNDIHCDKDRAVAEYLVKNLPWQRYRKIVLDCTDIGWNNREEPDSHFYRTETGEPKLMIYRKIKGD